MISRVAAHLTAYLADPPTGGATPGDTDLPSALNDKLSTLMGWGLRLGYVACFFGFVYCAGKMAISHRQGDDVNFGGLATVAAACLILGSAAGIADALVF